MFSTFTLLHRVQPIMYDVMLETTVVKFPTETSIVAKNNCQSSAIFELITNDSELNFESIGVRRNCFPHQVVELWSPKLAGSILPSSTYNSVPNVEKIICRRHSFHN